MLGADGRGMVRLFSGTISITPVGTLSTLQYFEAVREGRRRAAKSQMRLFDAAGFAMLTLTTKKVSGQFLPVGEEEYAAVILASDGHVVILADGDGFTKAQSKPVDRDEAGRIFKTLRDEGVEPFAGQEITIWTQTHPVVHDDI